MLFLHPRNLHLNTVVRSKKIHNSMSIQSQTVELTMKLFSPDPSVRGKIPSSKKNVLDQNPARTSVRLPK